MTIDCYGVYTNNPPCGAMRGFGAVQAGFAYESQMDKLAEALGMDPVDVRIRNAMSEGSRDADRTGGRLGRAGRATAEARAGQAVCPPERPTRHPRTARWRLEHHARRRCRARRSVTRVGIKNICFSEGYDDYSTARVRVSRSSAANWRPRCTPRPCEVGQGLVTIMQQIVRTELGIERVTVLPMDTTIGNGGSTSASRQTYVTGGAVKAALRVVRCSRPSSPVDVSDGSGLTDTPATR